MAGLYCHFFSVSFSVPYYFLVSVSNHLVISGYFGYLSPQAPVFEVMVLFFIVPIVLFFSVFTFFLVLSHILRSLKNECVYMCKYIYIYLCVSKCSHVHLGARGVFELYLASFLFLDKSILGFNCSFP